MADIDDLMATDLLFPICMFLAAVLIVCRIALWVYRTALERQVNGNKGVLVEDYTAEEVAVIVRRNLACPLVQEMGTDEQGVLFFQCDKVRFQAKIEAGRLFIVKKNLFGRDVIQNDGEGFELQQCISDIFSENPEKDREAFEQKKRRLRIGNRVDWVAGAIMCLCIFYILVKMLRGVDIVKSHGICLMKFSDYSTEYTINEALHATCIDGEWSCTKEGGVTYAYFVGMTQTGNRLMMIFRSEDNEYCEITSVQIDGEDYSLFTGVLLEGMYANLEGD